MLYTIYLLNIMFSISLYIFNSVTMLKKHIMYLTLSLKFYFNACNGYIKHIAKIYILKH